MASTGQPIGSPTAVNPETLSPHPKNEQLYGAEELPGDFLASVREHGIREPLVITTDEREGWPVPRVVSGHRRLEAARECDLEAVPIREATYEDALAEREALIDHNRQRRKTPAQVINEAEELLAIEQARAEQRKAATQIEDGEPPAGPDRSTNTESKGPAREQVGEQLGVSGSTIERGLRVKERADEGDEQAQQEWEKLAQDEQSIHGAYESVREADDDQDDAPDDLGPETYECSVCGEPWQEWDLAAIEGESVAVERVCVIDHPDDVVIHFAGEVPGT